MNFDVPTTNPAPPGKAVLLAACLILVAVLAAYSNTFHSEFHFDDYHQIVKNQNIRDLSNLPRFFTDIRLGTYMHGPIDFFRPITSASFAVNYAMSGYDTWSYHLVNIALHFINSLLVFLIISAVLRQAGREDPYYVSLFAALAFALHPIQTGAVTYISSRSVLLAGMFFLLAFYCFLRYRASDGAKYGYVFAVAAPALYFMGLLSKEVAVSLPAMVILFDVFFTFPRKGKSYKSVYYYTAFVLALEVFMAWRKHMLIYATLDPAGYSVGQYLLSESNVLLMYVRLLVLPMNQNFDYALQLTKSFDVEALLSAVLCLLAAASCYLLRKKVPGLGFFGLWFFIALAPESSLIPIKDTAVECRLYLPSVGFIAALSILARRYVTVGSLRKGIAVTVLAVCLVLSFNRNKVFATEQTLWNDVAGKSPNSSRAHLNLGHALLAEKSYREASAELRRSLEINPSSYGNYASILDLGICCYNQKYYKDAEEAFKTVIEFHPNDAPEAYYDLGRIYAETGRQQDSVNILLKGISVDPNYALTHLLLADLYMRQDKKADALREGIEARRCLPGDFDINYNLVIIYAGNGMLDKARETAGEALSLAQDEQQRKDAQALADRLR